MTIWRQWILPILRILLVAAIAVALVKIAFFSGSDDALPEEPSGGITNPTIAATIGSVYNNVFVSGTIAATAPAKLRANGTGVVAEVYAGSGRTVKKGQRLLLIKEELFTEKGTSTSWKTVKAGAAGKVALTVIKGQSVTTGDEIGSIDRGTFRVSGMVSPELLFRLLDLPSTANVTINGGPAPFDCTGLRLDSTENGTEVACAVPKEVRVFAGLMAEIAIPAGVAENVLVLPTTAVEGSADAGNVYIVLPDGSTEVRAVVLGLNDGVNIEIKEGLAEGELVLQFVPGANAVPEFPGGEPMPGKPVQPPVEEPLPIDEPGIEEPIIDELPVEGDGAVSVLR